MSSGIAFSGFSCFSVFTRDQVDKGATQHDFSRRDICRLGVVLAASKALPVWGCEGDRELAKQGRPADMQKQLFAREMENGMVEYEKRIACVKQELFSQISESERVADVGMGTGPNLRYLRRGTHVLGVDPNEYMWPYANKKARKYGIDLDVVKGVCEELPLEANSYDAVITTLTLCSVEKPSQAIREILRVLKPGGRLFFVEHVIADPSHPIFRTMQNLLNPLQVALCDGCHLNRNTAKQLQEEAGFSEIKYDEFDVGGYLSPIRPHIAGYARKRYP